MNWNYFANNKLAAWVLLMVMGISTNSLAQTTWTGMGSDSNWSNTSNWDTGIAPLGTTADVIIGAPSPTTLNVNVDLNSLLVDVDGILDFANSRNLDFGGTATTTLMNMGTINVTNNSDLQLAGTTINNGVINVQTLGNVTSLEIDSVAELTGGGTINLSGGSGNSRFDGVNDAVLTIVDQTIQGNGNVGSNTASFVNQSDGLIDANQLDLILNVDPDANGFINDGTLQASGGGILRVDGFGGGTFENVNGVMQALAGSELRLDANATINGGTVRTEGDGVVNVSVSQNVFLSDLTLDANVVVNNNSDLGIEGNIINTGTITATSAGNGTGIEIQSGGATISGSGEIVLTGNFNARIDGLAPVTIDGGRLSGIGQVLVESTFDGATLAAGTSIGTLTFNNATNFLNGTCIEFETSSANATPGTTSDQIVINGDLNLQNPTLASGLEIKMITLDGKGDPNPMLDFDPSQNYSFVVAVADQITGYSPGIVTIDTSGFQNPFTGTFSATIGPNGSDQALYVKYGQFQLGDINQDGAINLLDVAPFVDLLSSGSSSFDKATLFL